MKLTLFTIVFSSTLLGPVISRVLDTNGENTQLRGLEDDGVCKGNRLTLEWVSPVSQRTFMRLVRQPSLWTR
jgi:hypothetical protein